MLSISFVLLAVHALGTLAAPAASSHANGQGGLRIPVSKRQLSFSSNGTVSLDALDQYVEFMEGYVSDMEVHHHLNI